jgi:hypothetical protein
MAEHVLSARGRGRAQSIDEFLHSIRLCDKRSIFPLQGSETSLARVYRILARINALGDTTLTARAGAIALSRLSIGGGLLGEYGTVWWMGYL